MNRRGAGPGAAAPLSDRALRVEPAADGLPLAGFLRAALGRPWSEVRRLVDTGKVFVDGRRAERAGQPVAAGQEVALRMAAPRPRDGRAEVRIVHEDAQVVVIDKPPGVSTVPYETRERGTAMDLLRDAWRRQGRAATRIALHVVHRIDKDTSGLVVFAKSKRAEIGLAAQFRAHRVDRRYLCLAEGDVRFRRVESHLVRDRGDGLRGSSSDGSGKRAITHVEVLERFAMATLCRVRLETGRTHQIRIHFSERGHPVVGETVYIRDLRAPPGFPRTLRNQALGRTFEGGAPPGFPRALRNQALGRTFEGGAPPGFPRALPSERLMLHAETLGFAHPTTGAWLSFSAPAPDFETDAIERLLQAARRGPRR